jgi:hypothetical protein
MGWEGRRAAREINLNEKSLLPSDYTVWTSQWV